MLPYNLHLYLYEKQKQVEFDMYWYQICSS